MDHMTAEQIIKNLREVAYKAELKKETTVLCSTDLMLAWASELERLDSNIRTLNSFIESDPSVKVIRQYEPQPVGTVTLYMR